MKSATKALNSTFARSRFVAGCRILLAALLWVGIFARDAAAWGPHGKITEAALKTLPDAARWKAVVGDNEWRNLSHEYCSMPDVQGRSFNDFYYVNDYLLIRQCPQQCIQYLRHDMPEVQQTFEPYFRRALQALRTETPINACRQIGPILHFVEDAGAPPHTRFQHAHHSELENWVREDQIVITGYRPRLLGRTDDEAVAGLLRRLDGLNKFSKARLLRALPLVSEPSPDRAKVEPIILESALESARVTADLFHTLFTLGLAPQPEGASLSGDVTAGTAPLLRNRGARIVLLDTDYATLATMDKSRSKGASWHGGYAFHNLPPGSYRVLAYRTGSQFRVSEPIDLKAGKPARLDIALSETDPPGNLVQNPDGRLSYVNPDIPDRWRKYGDNGWDTEDIPVNAKQYSTYRCGAILKDPAAHVVVWFNTPPEIRHEHIKLPLEFNGKLRAEATVHLDAKYGAAVIIVHSSHPLTDTIEKVWLLPESRKSPAAQRMKTGPMK
jgi:hypothetical protein